MRVSARARAPIGSDDPLNRLLQEVFHVLLQFSCFAAPILADVHRHTEGDVVAFREVRGRLQKFVTTNDVDEQFHPIDASFTLIEFSEPVRKF